jgi:predicted TIM-barrel fold metal-dependent hydrolase
MTTRPERFYGFYCINPNRTTDTAEEFRQAVGRGFSGLKLAPIVHRFALTSEAVRDLARVCGELDVPLYSHVVFSPGASTEKFGVLAKEFPNTKFILGHMGFGPADVEAVELAFEHDNVYLESSGGSYMIIKLALDRVGPGKLIYGSEFPMHHPQVELEKIRLLAKDSDFEKITSTTLLSVLN